MTKEYFAKWLCEKLKEETKPRITQSSLAREIGSNRSTICHWCSGNRSPSKTLQEKLAICSIFGKDIALYSDEFYQNLSLIKMLIHNQEMRIKDSTVDAIAEKPVHTEEDIEVMTDWVLQQKDDV